MLQITATQQRKLSYKLNEVVREGSLIRDWSGIVASGYKHHE